MKLVFMGTPPEAARVLRTLVGAGHEVVLVVTQPDRKRGRTNKLLPTPVKEVATELGLPVTHKMKDALATEATTGVIVQFGRLVKEPVLSHLRWLNLHPSLLPRWRGSTPVESAILARDTQTGVCVMGIEETMDTGPIYKQWTTNIGHNESAFDLSNRLFDKGAELLLEVLANPAIEPVAQVGQPTFAEKFDSGSFRLDFAQPAEVVNRFIRLGRAWTTLNGDRFRILEAEVVEIPQSQNPAPNRALVDERSPLAKLLPGELLALEGRVFVGASSNCLSLLSVKPQSKGEMRATDWANGARLVSGTRFI